MHTLTHKRYSVGTNIENITERQGKKIVEGGPTKKQRYIKKLQLKRGENMGKTFKINVVFEVILCEF